MKHHKILRVIRDGDYGFSRNKVIHVNIQRIWQETSRENRFIPIFTKTYLHELLHILLWTTKNMSVVGEERAVRRLMKEPWNRILEAGYCNDDRTC